MRAGRIYRIPVAASGLGRCAGAVAADRSGNVLIADQARHLALVAAIRSGTFYGIRMRAGRVYRLAGDGRAAFSGAGGPARDAGLSPLHVVADGQGDVFIVDNAEAGQIAGDRVLMIPARPGTFYGIPMAAGHIYAVAGDGGDADRNAVAATRTGMYPSAVAVDAHGNLVVAADDQVQVAPAREESYGRVRVVAARDGEFYGRAMRTGYIYTVAGPFPGVHDVAVDPRGDILVLDAEAKVVRLVAAGSGYRYGQRVAAGRVCVVAGRGRGQKSLAGPQAIAVARMGGC
jgi:DNA-binding beta-propeller fold protein YncE